MGLDLPWPIDLGYIVCDPCFDGNCADCIGLTHTRPFCGHRCPWLEVIDDVERPRD